MLVFGVRTIGCSEMTTIVYETKTTQNIKFYTYIHKIHTGLSRKKEKQIFPIVPL